MDVPRPSEEVTSAFSKLSLESSGKRPSATTQMQPNAPGLRPRSRREGMGQNLKKLTMGQTGNRAGTPKCGKPDCKDENIGEEGRRGGAGHCRLF